jgi:endo-beta-N-acetylglucosaminidase D
MPQKSPGSLFVKNVKPGHAKIIGHPDREINTHGTTRGVSALVIERTEASRTGYITSFNPGGNPCGEL